MANEIDPSYTPGQNLYAVVKTATGLYCAGVTPESFQSAHWGTYAIPLAEYPTATGQYHADFPLLPAGVYRVEVYLRAGGSPAPTDGPPIFEGSIAWDGTAEVSPAALAAALGDVEAGVSFHAAMQVLAAFAGGNVVENALHTTTAIAAIGNPSTTRLTSTNTTTTRVVTRH